MKIQIDKKFGNFEKQDLDYIKLLEFSKTFEDLVKAAREKLGLKHTLLKNYPTAKIYSIVQKHAKEIVDILTLSSPWVHPVSNFIVMGKMTSPGAGIYLSGMAPKYPSEEATDFQITITQKTSIDDIYKLLRKNKTAIQKHLNKLPPKNSPIKSESKLRLEVFKLHYQGLKPKAIVEELDRRHENDKGYIYPSPIDVSRWINDLQKKLTRQPR